MISSRKTFQKLAMNTWPSSARNSSTRVNNHKVTHSVQKERRNLLIRSPFRRATLWEQGSTWRCQLRSFQRYDCIVWLRRHSVPYWNCYRAELVCWGQPCIIFNIFEKPHELKKKINTHKDRSLITYHNQPADQIKNQTAVSDHTHMIPFINEDS